MLFDTDVLIWVQRGNQNAADVLDAQSDRMISVLTYMELLQSASDKRQHRVILSFLKQCGIMTLPLTENIGHRATIYIEEYTLSHGIRAADAIIAATAVENGIAFCSANRKHFTPIQELDFRHFSP